MLFEYLPEELQQALSSEQKAEWAAHPPLTICERIPIERIRIRREIADVMDKIQGEGDSAMADYREFYNRYKCSHFYTIPNSTVPRRMIGAALTRDGKPSAQMLTLRIGWINWVVGDVPEDEITPAGEDWTEEQYRMIEQRHYLPEAKAIFYDPLSIYFLNLGQFEEDS